MPSGSRMKIMIPQLLKAWATGVLLAGTIAVLNVYVFGGGHDVTDLSLAFFNATHPMSEVGLFVLVFASAFLRSLPLLAIAAAIAVPMDKIIVRNPYQTLLVTPFLYATIVSAFQSMLTIRYFNRPDHFIEFFGQNFISADLWGVCHTRHGRLGLLLSDEIPSE